MAAVHKKQESKTKEEKSVETKAQVKTRPVVVSDVITQTTEAIEVVEEVVPETTKSETPAESLSPHDPLSEFKEKMNEEELSAQDNALKKNYMWPILLIFIIVILLLVGVFLYKYGINIKDKVNEVTIVPSPTVIPQPTKTIDLTKYEIQILNGGSIDGEAGRQRTVLETGGFAIASVGNADNSDYTDTVIQTKKEVDKDFIAKLKIVLERSFTIGEIKSLPEDSSVPIVIILGTKK